MCIWVVPTGHPNQTWGEQGRWVDFPTDWEHTVTKAVTRGLVKLGKSNKQVSFSDTHPQTRTQAGFSKNMN